MPALVSPNFETHPGRRAFQGHSPAGHKQRGAGDSEDYMPRKYSEAERIAVFWSKVDRRGLTECWPWTGSCNEDGYGNASRSERAHRMAWKLTHGPIPPETPHVLHDCDNPPCCNPNPGHLKVGTHQQNMDDRGARNRTSRLCGESGPTAVLTDEIVSAARREYRASDVKCSELAARFGVVHSAMVSALNGDTWGHLEEPPVRKGKLNTRQDGTANRMARLDEAAVRDIRERHAAGESYGSLGRAYGVATETARRACVNLWRHIS